MCSGLRPSGGVAVVVFLEAVDQSHEEGLFGAVDSPFSASVADALACVGLTPPVLVQARQAPQ